MQTPLHKSLIAAKATMGEYCGANTARVFTDPKREYESLLERSGVYDLGWRSKIVVTGSDRARWLNGMVTNNIRDLAPGHGNYSFVLNAQGRIQADLYVYNQGEHFLIDTERWQAANLLQIFDKFIIMDDVEVTDISDKLTAIGLQGPGSTVTLQKVGIPLTETIEPLAVQQVSWEGIGISVVRMASDVATAFEIWLAPENAPKLWAALSEAGAQPVGTDALEMFRVAAGVPRFGQDIRDRDLPQETDQKRALHFAKGCYLGQEIVERIRSRGNVHRTLTGFELQGPPPKPGTKIRVAEKEVGEITSALQVPTRSADKTLALGYIRREAGEPGAQVDIEGVAGSVVRPPFKDALTASH